MKSFLLVSAFVLFFGSFLLLDAPPKQSHPFSDQELLSLRAEVRTLIIPRCGSCHTSTLPIAKPKAVAVFDLKNDDWSATVKIEQLKNFNTRIKDFSPGEKEKIERLLSAELARR